MLTNKTATQPFHLRNNASSHWVKGLQPSTVRDSEKALAIFQPDILIPDQFHATYERTLHLESEKILMLAILRDAVACFQEYLGASTKRKQQLYLDAEAWIKEVDRRYIFSFENICDLLGFEPSYLRQGLLHWQGSVLAARHGQRIAS